MSIRSNFKKWIVGFGALGGAMFFYPNDNDNNSQFLHTHKFGIAASSWDHNWDRYICILWYCYYCCSYKYFTIQYVIHN